MKKIYVTVSKQKIYIEAEDFFQFKDASVYDYKDGLKELKEDLAYINEHGKRRLDCLDSKQSMESLKKQFQDVLKTVCRYRIIKDVKPLSKHKGAEELERRIQNEQIAAKENYDRLCKMFKLLLDDRQETYAFRLFGKGFEVDKADLQLKMDDAERYKRRRAVAKFNVLSMIEFLIKIKRTGFMGLYMDEVEEILERLAHNLTGTSKMQEGEEQAKREKEYILTAHKKEEDDTFIKKIVEDYETTLDLGKIGFTISKVEDKLKKCVPERKREDKGPVLNSDETQFLGDLVEYYRKDRKTEINLQKILRKLDQEVNAYSPKLQEEDRIWIRRQMLKELKEYVEKWEWYIYKFWEEREKTPELETEEIERELIRRKELYDPESKRSRMAVWIEDKAERAKMEFEADRKFLEEHMMYSTYSLPGELKKYS